MLSLTFLLSIGILSLTSFLLGTIVTITIVAIAIAVAITTAFCASLIQHYAKNLNAGIQKLLLSLLSLSALCVTALYYKNGAVALLGNQKSIYHQVHWRCV